MRRRAWQAVRGRLAALRSAAVRGGAEALRRTRGLLWPLRPRHAAALLALGVVALGLHGMAFYSALPERLPAPLDWRSAAALLERDARPGDAVALSPWWAERAREVLPATLPVLAFPRLAGEELLGVRRVWLLSLPHAPGFRFDLEEDLAARAAGVEGPQRLGGLELTRYDLRLPSLPLAFLPDRLAAAEVVVGARACAPAGRGAFRCPPPAAATVAREVREVDALPRPCLTVLPSAAPLSITFPAVPLGRALRGHTGLVGEGALGRGAPLRLQVRIDGREVGTAEAQPGRPGWHAFQIDTAHDAGRVAALTFTVASPEPTQRLLCFDAYTLP